MFCHLKIIGLIPKNNKNRFFCKSSMKYFFELIKQFCTKKYLIPLQRQVKKAQVRAYLAGDPVWEEAVHRNFLDEDWWTTYAFWMRINPEETEYLPIPAHYRAPDNKFAFHEEKANYR